MYKVNTEPLVVQGAMPSHHTDGNCRSKESPNKSMVSRQPTTEEETTTSTSHRGYNIQLTMGGSILHYIRELDYARHNYWCTSCVCATVHYKSLTIGCSLQLRWVLI